MQPFYYLLAFAGAIIVIFIVLNIKIKNPDAFKIRLFRKQTLQGKK